MTLVSRLRERKLPVMAAAGQYEYVVNERPDELCEEAAAELERLQQRVEVLEGALRTIADEKSWRGFSPLAAYTRMREQARAALGEGR